MPFLDIDNAGRTIYHGYKNAFTDLGYKFSTFTANNNMGKIFAELKPNIFITSLNHYHLKFLNLDLLKKQKQKGLKVFVNTPLWNSPISKFRINEAPSLSKNKQYIKLIKSGDYGDIYFNSCENDDPRMDGFEKGTGYKHHTIPLAADKLVIFPQYSKKFKADISYIGTYLPEKKKIFETVVFPLRKKCDLKIYGQGWTFSERLINNLDKLGKYFNLPLIKSLQKPKLLLEDERKIYTSSIISINVHEEYQKKFGGDCNERTFKIPLAGGFEITDNVACIRKYLVDGKEIIIAKNKKEWFDKIGYYIKNPEKRLPIIEAGKKKILKEHTYHNRVKQIIEIYNSIK